MKIDTRGKASTKTPSVASVTASNSAGVAESPRNTMPKATIWTASVLVRAVATTKEFSRMASSISAVARTCAADANAT